MGGSQDQSLLPPAGATGQRAAELPKAKPADRKWHAEPARAPTAVLHDRSCQLCSPWYTRWLPPRGWCGLPRGPPPPLALALQQSPTRRRNARSCWVGLTASPWRAPRVSTPPRPGPTRPPPRTVQPQPCHSSQGGISAACIPSNSGGWPSPHECAKAAHETAAHAAVHAARKRGSHHKHLAVRPLDLRCTGRGGTATGKRRRSAPKGASCAAGCLPGALLAACLLYSNPAFVSTHHLKPGLPGPLENSLDPPALTIWGPPPGPYMPPGRPSLRRRLRLPRCRSCSACIFCSLQARRCGDRTGWR